MMRLIQMVLLLTGLLMVAAPGACTRKDDRGKPETEKRTRTIGGWLTAAADYLDDYGSVEKFLSYFGYS